VLRSGARPRNAATAASWADSSSDAVTRVRIWPPLRQLDAYRQPYIPSTSSRGSSSRSFATICPRGRPDHQRRSHPGIRHAEEGRHSDRGRRLPVRTQRSSQRGKFSVGRVHGATLASAVARGGVDTPVRALASGDYGQCAARRPAARRRGLHGRPRPVEWLIDLSISSTPPARGSSAAR
jgi:hypothetical protein